MLGEIRLVGILVVVEGGGAESDPQDILDSFVKKGLVESSGLHAVYDLVPLVLGSGHQEVISCGDLPCSVLLGPPVGHHESVESPFSPKDVREDELVLGSEDSVDFVVGRHYGPGMGFLHRDLESLEVDFAESPFGKVCVDTVAVSLLVVDREVLDRCSDSVALDSVDVGGGYLSGQNGILGEIFEVTSAKGIAVDVHCGGEEHVNAVFLHLVAHRAGDFSDKFRIETCRQN